MEVKINEAAEPAKNAATPSNIVKRTLKDGRSVTIRRMGPSARMRMLSIIGAENSRNEMYVYSHAVPAFSVIELDGNTVPPPQNVLGLEALADRLGDEGLLEVLMAIGEAWGGAETQAILNEVRQEVKN